MSCIFFQFLPLNFFTYQIKVSPVIINGPMEMTVQEKDILKLTCVASGSPKPIIAWEKEGINIPIDSRRYIELHESTNIATGINTVRK